MSTSENGGDAGPASVPATKVPSAWKSLLRLGAAPPLLALGSQGAGTLQLVLLLAHGSSRSTDSYFLQFTSGTFVANAYVWGVVYPRLLRGDRRGLTLRSAAVSSLLAALFSAASAAYLLIVGHYPIVVIPGAIALAGNAILATVVAVASAVQAAGGDARAQAASNLVPNLGACLALAICWSASDPVRVAVMAGGLAIGNSTLLVLLKKSLLYLRRPPTPLAAGPEHQDGPASPAFYAKALTGYGAGLLFQACASQLPAGVSSVYNVVIRIGGAFVTVLVNPLLPRFVTTDRTNYTAVGKLTGTGFAISFALTITLRFTHLGSWSETAVLGAIWIGCATCNAALSRVGYRELPVAFWWIPSALVAVVGAGTFLLVANDSSALWLASGVLLVELGSALITAAALRIIDLLFLIVSAVLAGADMAGTPAAGLTVCALGGLIAVVLAILISSSAARQGRASLYTPKVRPGRHRGEKGGRQDDAPLVARPRPGVLETPAASEEVWIKQPVAFPATMPISYRRRTGNE